MNGRNARKLSNLLIAPRAQLFFVFCFVSFGLILSVSYHSIIAVPFGNMIYDSPGTTAYNLMSEVFTNPELLVVVVMALFVLLCMFFALMITHRIYGPVIPINRHIEELIAGNFTHQTQLRKRDELQSIADNLNRLSQKLQKKGS